MASHILTNSLVNVLRSVSSPPGFTFNLTILLFLLILQFYFQKFILAIDLEREGSPYEFSCFKASRHLFWTLNQKKLQRRRDEPDMTFFTFNLSFLWHIQTLLKSLCDLDKPCASGTHREENHLDPLSAWWLRVLLRVTAEKQSQWFKGLQEIFTGGQKCWARTFRISLTSFPSNSCCPYPLLRSWAAAPTKEPFPAQTRATGNWGLKTLAKKKAAHE